MKTKAKYRFLLILITAIFTMGYYQLKAKASDSDLVSPNHKVIHHKLETDPDKTLLIGEWSRTGTPYFIKITDVLDLGKLEIGFYDPNYPHKIEIEKANWQKIGTLLSVYIELQDPVYPGSNFKLNYIPERDVLVGTYFDAVTGYEYPMEFIRIK